jgi:Tfp pilus assembly protein PilO
MNPYLAKLAGLKLNQALLFGGILSGLFYMSMYDDGSQLDARIQSTQVTLDQEVVKGKESDRALARVTELKNNYSILSDQFKLASSQIPTEMQMSEIIRTVDVMSKASNVVVKAKEPRNTLKEDILEVYPLKVQAEGGYSDLTKFFYSISTIERIFRIKSFSISAPTDEKKKKTLTLDAEFNSYRYVPATVAAEKPAVKK